MFHNINLTNLLSVMVQDFFPLAQQKILQKYNKNKLINYLYDIDEETGAELSFFGIISKLGIYTTPSYYKAYMVILAYL